MSEIKLYNDDCFNVMKQIPNESVDLILTDPPYFVLPKGKNNDRFEWDNFQDLKSFLEFTSNWFTLALNKLKNNSFMFIFWSQKYLKEGFNLFNPSRLIMWNYNNLILGGGGDFAYDYEPIFVVKKGNPKLTRGKHNCIMSYTKPQSNFKKDRLVHPCQKNLELIKHIIDISSQKNDTVLDCFMGSGTTGVACYNLNRNFIGMELDSKYFEIAKSRIKECQENIFDF